MNNLQKNLLAALPGHLQNEQKIREIASKNGVSFEEAVSLVFIKDAEQKEKNELCNKDILGGMIRSQKDPVVRLAQTYALTIRESETIINSQLARLERATSDELYAAGCAFLADKTFNSARSQIRRETQSPVRKGSFVYLDEDVCGDADGFSHHEVISDEQNPVLDWLVAAESVQAEIEERELEVINYRHSEAERSELEKTPEDIAKALHVTLRRGQQIAKHMRTAAIARQEAAQGGAGQTELF
ncbi:hypothetical protein F6A13_03545 [Acidithiobacillus sp. 'AMD consortium']|uniref:hypothetical protein n=1 Tax=Acidithiobacillus sp. 'AMD consortium' TaxID=2614801 RepID=UPI00124CAF10|nr:hypothetical protein [Acidithiobacillus sp. 'AMD consortium']QFG77810.1 hypothetical protein F6A13_03545 [Acidithiobacillus sp. 'AMD consortium']